MATKKPAVSDKVRIGGHIAEYRGELPIKDLIPYEMNVKKHDKAQVAGIVTSIQKFGFTTPIWIDRDGMIIAGHGRRLAAIELGMTHVPVIQSKNLWGDQARAARLADNRVAIGDIDTEMFRIEIDGIQDSLVGIFDDKELNFASVDLGLVNVGAFADDMATVLNDQKADLQERAANAVGDGTRVPLSKAFGFKDMPTAGQLAIAKLMAKAEATTGLKQDAALVAFAEAL